MILRAIKNEEPMFETLKSVLVDAYAVLHCQKDKVRLLHEKSSKESSEVASLTKIMTATLIILISIKFDLNIRL